MREAANMGATSARTFQTDCAGSCRIKSYQKLGKGQRHVCRGLRNGDAHITECNVMMEATCYSSAQMRTFIRETMRRQCKAERRDLSHSGGHAQNGGRTQTQRGGSARRIRSPPR